MGVDKRVTGDGLGHKSERSSCTIASKDGISRYMIVIIPMKARTNETLVALWVMVQTRSR